MSSNEMNVYNDPEFSNIDFGAIMRAGHPDIEDGDLHILRVVSRQQASLGRDIAVLEVGSGSGHLCRLLAEELPRCQVVANEVAEAPARQARANLEPYPNALVFDEPFDRWTQPLDVVISWGSHHHLRHDYIAHVRRLLRSDGLFIVGDELCPEYLTEADQARLDRAQLVQIEGGYIFDNSEDLDTYRNTGVVPAWSLHLEDERRRALWTWYKFVFDYAVERDAWPVVIGELQIARDDLVTAFAGEHKTSAHLLKRELELQGFTIVDYMTIGDRNPALQSFAIFTCKAEAI